MPVCSASQQIVVDKRLGNRRSGCLQLLQSCYDVSAVYISRGRSKTDLLAR